MIKYDLFRECGSFSFFDFLKVFIVKRSFRPIVSLRLCQFVNLLPRPMRLVFFIFARALHKLTCSIAGVDLPWETKIGAGFAITHGWGLVVAPGAIIGRNVTLFHGVTLGRRDRIFSNGERAIGYPTIEDEVWIGPHAIIVGDVIIGRGSRIAGGAYVHESIPPYSVVLGNPAKVVRSNCSPDVPNRIPD